MSRGAGKSQRLRERNPSSAQTDALIRERLWQQVIRSSGEVRDELLGEAEMRAVQFHGQVGALTTRAGSLSMRATALTSTAARVIPEPSAVEMVAPEIPTNNHNEEAAA